MRAVGCGEDRSPPLCGAGAGDAGRKAVGAASIRKAPANRPDSVLCTLGRA